MKCKKIELLIYLYNELDERERHQVDIHMDECTSCKLLFVQVSNQQLLIRKSGEMPILPASPELVKRNIMQALESNKENWFDEFIMIINMYWLRASLAVASILLTGFFFFELSADSYPIATNSTYSDSGSIHLNTSKFLKSQLRKRESINQISFYDCLKQSDCDFLKTSKPIRTYEKF